MSIGSNIYVHNSVITMTKRYDELLKSSHKYEETLKQERVQEI